MSQKITMDTEESEFEKFSMESLSELLMLGSVDDRLVKSIERESNSVETLQALSAQLAHIHLVTQQSIVRKLERLRKEVEESQRIATELSVKFKDTVPKGNVVKLNLRGTYFSCSTEHLQREPNTFFSSLLSGRWSVNVDPADQALFMNRSPHMFGYILDYLAGDVTVHQFPVEECEAIFADAKFYGLTKLMGELQFMTGVCKLSTFSPKTMGSVQFSHDFKMATVLGNGTTDKRVMANTPFPLVDPVLGYAERKVCIHTSGTFMAVGLAHPNFLVDSNLTVQNNGIHLLNLKNNAHLFRTSSNSPQHDPGVGYLNPKNNGAHLSFTLPQNVNFQVGSIVTVRITRDKKVVFFVDDQIKQEQDLWANANPNEVFLVVTLQGHGASVVLL